VLLLVKHKKPANVGFLFLILIQFYLIFLQKIPLKHLSILQSQIFTSWLYAGGHPQAPIRQLFGKSPVALQQKEVATVPPEIKQACSLFADR